MTRDEIGKVLAGYYIDGKEIQFVEDGRWTDCRNVVWRFDLHDYRIKPEELPKPNVKKYSVMKYGHSYAASCLNLADWRTDDRFRGFEYGNGEVWAVAPLFSDQFNNSHIYQSKSTDTITWPKYVLVEQ